MSCSTEESQELRRQTTGRTTLAILTVTHDDASELEGYFSSLERLEGDERWQYEVVVVDSGSRDDTASRLNKARLDNRLGRWPLHTVALEDNVGFASGMNRALAEVPTGTPLVVSLNADARPEPRALIALAESWRRYDGLNELRVGAVTGRLVRARKDNAHFELDACGMYLSPSWRHFDRGSGRMDRGQFSRAELVFGATGAGSLFVREALRDVAVDGQVFDETFHSFREDAELAFRLQERGWSVVYEPSAAIEHRRFNLPSRRAHMPPEVNFHALKNRYLLRLYHQTPGNLLVTGVPTAVRELGIVLYALLRERSSLAVYRWLWHHRSQAWRRRQLVQQRRTVAPRSVNRWFWQKARTLPEVDPG